MVDRCLQFAGVYCLYISLRAGQVSIRKHGDAGKNLLTAQYRDHIWDSYNKYSSAIGRPELIMGLED